MSLKKLGGETLVYGLSNILGRLLNFVLVTYFITRLMPAEEYGVVSGLMFWTALLIALLVFRMDTIVFRFASRGEYAATAVFRKAQRFVVWSVVVVLGGMFLLAEPLADWLQYPDRVVYIQLVLATVAFDALSAVPLARLRLEQRAWFFVTVNLGNVLVNMLLIFLLLYVWRWNAGWVAEQTGIVFDVNYQVGYYLLSIALASAFRYGFLLIDGLIKYRSDGVESVLDGKAASREGPPLKTMLVYSLPLTLVAVAGIVNFLVAPEIIKFYHGGSITQNLRWSGYFGAATKLAVVLNLFVTAYNYAAEPFFFRQVGNDLATADRTIYADATRAYALIAALASAGILLFQPWLELMIDQEERAGLVVLPLLLAGNFFFGLYSNFAVAYKLTDKTYFGGAIALTGSGIVIGGSLLFINDHGIFAVATAMLVCFVVMCLLAWLVSRRYFRVDYPLGRILVYAVLASGTVWSVAHFGVENMLVRVVVFLVLAATLFAIEMRWIRKTFLS